MKLQNLFATAEVATLTVSMPVMAQVTNVSQLRDVQPYLGAAVTLNRQGINGGGKDFNDTVAGATIVGSVPVYTWKNQNAVDLRPYVAFAAGPDSQIGSSMGALFEHLSVMNYQEIFSFVVV